MIDEDYSSVPWPVVAYLERDRKIGSKRQAERIEFRTRVHPQPYTYDRAATLLREILAPLIDAGWVISSASIKGWDSEYAQ